MSSTEGLDVVPLGIMTTIPSVLTSTVGTGWFRIEQQQNFLGELGQKLSFLDDGATGS
jgi:hypothetical protein